MLPDLKLIFRTYPCLRISGSAVPSIERLYGGDSALSSQPELKERQTGKGEARFQNKSTEKADDWQHQVAIFFLNCKRVIKSGS